MIELELTRYLTEAGIAIALVSAAITAAIIHLLYPLLCRYTLARLNSRSSHKRPTPQGGGIAVVASVILLASAVVFFAPIFAHASLIALFAATIALAIVGTIDDIRPLEAPPRLLLQGIAVAIVIAALPDTLRVVPVLPWWIERALLFVGLLWFINLTNFMDGIDWMTVAEVVPVTAALAAFGFRGALPHAATLVALVLCGAMLGFAPFNRPVARLFLGDVGSLPIGLLLGWLFILLAQDHLAAAVLLPLYYLADATITLFRRLVRGDHVMQAHRSHFYQRALDGGMSVMQIVGQVFGLNVLLALLALATMLIPTLAAQTAALVIGSVSVGLVLYRFAHTKR